MTFCLGISLEKEGLVGISDTRILTGNECATAAKCPFTRNEHYAMFLMTPPASARRMSICLSMGLSTRTTVTGWCTPIREGGPAGLVGLLARALARRC